MEDKQYKINRREQNLNFLKFVLSTLILGLAANYINLHIQQSKIDFEIRKEETRMFQSYLDRYTLKKTPEEKLDFLKFLSTMSQSLEVRARYDSLHNFVLKQIKIKKESNQKIDSLILKNPDKATEMDRLEKIIITGETNNQTTVEVATEKLNNILQEDDIREAIDLADKINQTENKISLFENTKPKLTNKEAQQIILSENGWLKEGYYKSYNNYFLGINDLDVNEEEVTFQLRKSKSINEIIIKDFVLKIGEKEEEIINTDELIVIIRLNSIGSAGKNPFKKAAKYNVTILKNSTY